MPNIIPATLGESNYSHHYSMWLALFTCPNCEESEIQQEFSFCPDCGQPIEWDYDSIVKLEDRLNRGM